MSTPGTLKKIKNKLTDVEFWDTDRTLCMYRSLPDIRTGGNPTLTIICDLFNQGFFDECVHLRINWDGDSDNVNLVVFKFSAMCY